MGNDFPMCCHTNWWDILGVRECLYVSTHARLPIKCVRVCGWVCLSHAATAVATDALVSAWIVNEPLLWVVCVKSRCAGVRLHTRIRILASDSLMWFCLDCGFSVVPQHSTDTDDTHDRISVYVRTHAWMSFRVIENCSYWATPKRCPFYCRVTHKVTANNGPWSMKGDMLPRVFSLGVLKTNCNYTPDARRASAKRWLARKLRLSPGNKIKTIRNI